MAFLKDTDQSLLTATQVLTLKGVTAAVKGQAFSSDPPAASLPTRSART